MTTPTLRRLFTGAFAASCLAGLPAPAVHAVGVTPVTDTVTDLYLDWSFAISDSGFLAPYVGSYWLAEILPTWTGMGWSVDAWYQHLGGPHGEPPEPLLHYMGSVTFIAGAGAGMIMPVQDHESLPSSHLGAHIGLLAGNGPPIGASPPPGFARQIVAHVPEPAQWWLMLAGLAGLAAMVRRRA